VKGGAEHTVGQFQSRDAAGPDRLQPTGPGLGQGASSGMLSTSGAAAVGCPHILGPRPPIFVAAQIESYDLAAPGGGR